MYYDGVARRRSDFPDPNPNMPMPFFAKPKALRRVSKRLALAGGLFLAAGAVIADDAPTRGFAELSDAFTALAIQGDLRGAERLFDSALWAGPAGAALRAQFAERFLASGEAIGPKPDDDFAARIAHAYRAYWRSKLMREADTHAADNRLDAAVASALERHGRPSPPGVDPWPVAERALRDAGLHVSAAATPPWRDLFVWAEERRETFHVELTDTTLPVEVLFMDGFVVQGWKDFASLGLAATSGWVENGRLYCVAWAYDLASENFEVSYLKHEARHLADLERYPDMDSTELEYRAKLTELAFARNDLERIWSDFRAKAAENPDSPHAMANWRVVRDVEGVLDVAPGIRRPFTASPSFALQVNRAARRLLEDSTRRQAAPSARGGD